MIKYGREKEKHIFHFNSVVNNSIKEISFSKSIKMSHSGKNDLIILNKGKTKEIITFLLEDSKKHDVKCLPKYFQVLSKLNKQKQL